MNPKGNSCELETFVGINPSPWKRVNLLEVCDGRHEGAGENISFVDLGVVEEDGEGFCVEENDDVWVGGEEGARWHVGTEDS